MRHRKAGKKLNRSSNHRKALVKNIAKELFRRGEITTTEAKAKVVQRSADKLITRAKKQDLASRKMIQSFFSDRVTTTRLFDVVAPQLTKRNSGYTRLTKLGPRRGDNAMMVRLSLVDPIAQPELIQAANKKANKTKHV